MYVDLERNSYQAHNILGRLDKVCVSYLEICFSATPTLLNKKLWSAQTISEPHQNMKHDISCCQVVL